MKSIHINLLEDEEIPFWDNRTLEVNTFEYEKFTTTDKQLLEDLIVWLGYKKEADQA